jgi:hypothetical protein
MVTAFFLGLAGGLIIFFTGTAAAVVVETIRKGKQ